MTEDPAAFLLRKRSEELAKQEDGRGIVYIWRKIVVTVTSIFKKA